MLISYLFQNLLNNVPILNNMDYMFFHYHTFLLLLNKHLIFSFLNNLIYLNFMLLQINHQLPLLL